jgi:hypothetical protein
MMDGLVFSGAPEFFFEFKGRLLVLEDDFFFIFNFALFVFFIALTMLLEGGKLIGFEVVVVGFDL